MDPHGRQHIFECGTEFGVSVVQHVTALAEYFRRVADSIASHLRHPRFGRMSGDAGERHPPALQVEEEEDVIGNETTPGQDLDGEEVCPGKGGDEVPPTRILAAFRRWSDAVPLQNVSDRLIGDGIAEVRERADNAIVIPSLLSWAMRAIRASSSGPTRGRPG